MKKLLTISIGLILVISCCYISENNLNTKDQDPANIIYANSCSRADIQEAYDNASDGDIIMIPPGDSTWDSPYCIEISKQVSLIGAGTSETIIRIDVDSNEATFQYYWFKDGGYEDIEIAHFKIVGPGPGESSPWNSCSGIAMWGGPRNFKIHDMVFQDLPSVGLQIRGEIAGDVSVRQPWGVIYDCSFIDCYKPGLGYGVAVWGDNATWQDPLILGSSEAVFIEDCYFSGCRHSVEAQNCGQYVFRYNTIVIDPDQGGNIDAHGNRLTSANWRGTRSYEVYENTLSAPEPYSWAINIRGGDGVVFNNTMTGFTGDRVIYFVNEVCPGCGGYPCPDQVREAYIWGNTNNGLPINGVPTNCQDEGEYLIREDRDIFNYEKPGYMPYTYPHPLRWYDLPLRTNGNTSSPSGYAVTSWLWPRLRWQTVMQIFK